MKKLLCLLFAALLLTACVPALGEGAVVVSSLETKEADPLEMLRDVKIGESIDLGDRLILPYDNAVDWNNSETQNISLYVEVTNLATKKQLFFKDAQVVVTYTTERGEYKFDGFVRTGSSRTSTFSGTALKEIDPLFLGHYCFRCTVPNYVMDNPGSIKMEITFGDYTMTWIARAE